MHITISQSLMSCRSIFQNLILKWCNQKPWASLRKLINLFDSLFINYRLKLQPSKNEFEMKVILFNAHECTCACMNRRGGGDKNVRLVALAFKQMVSRPRQMRKRGSRGRRAHKRDSLESGTRQRTEIRDSAEITRLLLFNMKQTAKTE